MRNCVSCDWRLDPEISRASLGAGTCQNNMAPPRRRLREGRDDDRTRRGALDDQHPGVLGDRLIRPRRERLRPTPHGYEHFARTGFGDRDGDPSDGADHALFSVRLHVRTPSLPSAASPLLKLVLYDRPATTHGWRRAASRWRRKG